MKFLLIFLLVIFVIYKLSGFFMRILFSTLSNSARDTFAGHQQQRANRAADESKHQRPMDGNVNIDYVPGEQKKQPSKPKTKFKGGEYVDYEEIRD
ncbi:MAG: DUF4834 family protein [Cyclobacteriaceae bacterium]